MQKILNPKTFFKFAFVGSIGLCVNLTLFYFLTKISININISSIISFLFATFSNFLFNSKFTFKRHYYGHILIAKYFKYLSVNILGLLINLITLNAVISYYGADLQLFGQALGVILGMMFNYTLALKKVFI
ncbi:hypothetical protein VI34_06495 [Methylophilales bacterium MBRSG12]|uniref:GtrA/DPMS transmembrane domain-containing protein n=1 Tax=Methylophilales bacterium MBRS-H7 TaxID=1623450 RepID=A0A0H4J2T1_9PROT|nr:hypothetical protein UZ34_03830 [Methylophilales bacterium MBRSF5]AKO66310.1 hypothetical protein VI33_06505 [Methylophilales bacterium MBRS-H7]AKO67626.1 hypothetical protein VI34_06495 [Methylophilales bacterium MBRSG12]